MNPMKYPTRTQDGVFVLELRGKMMGGPESQEFHEQLKAALSAGHKEVVLDLGGVEWMNSSGLGMLISALTTMRNAGGEMKLARVTNKIESLLVITKLNSVFDSHPTVASAAASFH
jgi:anti-sigma B factor antagonist